ncbi:MAG: EVE domain-containing protein [Alphaproteobacteria bacterium]|nr:EVE domain-containing protein [Alphaproteobacteria bacterium]
MAYWLMKAEPNDYTFEDLERDGVAEWDGIHNHQAANNMRAMKKGERVFFYRSQKDPAVVGIMEIAREAYEDPDDPKESFVLVDVKAVRPVAREVSLKAIKAEPRLKEMPLVRQSRLSVSPVSDEAWRLICQMANTEA